MKLIAYLRRRYAWMNLSTVGLVALLQRSPAIRLVAIADEYVAASPVGTIVKYAAAAIASLGAMNSMAGATILASSITMNPTGPLPTFDATVNQPISNLAFTITNTMNIASWKVTGPIPPGLKLEALENTAISVTGTGVLDATTPGSSGTPWGGATTGNNTTTPVLVGTPTTAGTYTFMLQGFADPNEQGGSGASFVGTGISDIFSFTVDVTAAVSPDAPAFTVQPISAAVSGGTVVFDAVASNSPTYQWMLNGEAIAGATSSTLRLSNAAASAGTYTSVATNSAGTATSNPAKLTIDNTTNIGRLVNISCRATVGTGGNILIAGFVVGGAGTSGSEPLLIRASGPALVPFGVPGTLADPQLQLFSGSNVLESNDAWGGSNTISSAASSVGAFAWSSPTSHDSAILDTLAEGPYTAQVAGESGDTGVALAEVYDATSPYTATSPRIVNISARVQVGTGGNILIVGFAVGGATSRTVLIRASGPALVPFGVTGTLPDPQLQLFSGSTVLDSNTGWGGDATISSTAASVGAFAWGSTTSNDSAILVTLPPGPYTAQVSGASGDTGVALVEVYEVP